ncbi:MAG TPA: sulfatase-like hydrolase/transferase [Verrucomicrobiae bacterium]|nr:sulfatase-like hydrolase/transferase [Verrucomicrobiae bacterium]
MKQRIKFRRRSRGRLLALGLAFAACLALRPASAAQTSKPNIIFLLTDDMGYGDVGCYGGKFVPTPNIDRLAKEGTRFTQFYVASPVCSPSRTGLLTGMCPARWHITNYLQTKAGNRASEQADFLDPKAPSYARALKAAGYVTGHFGKWHMGGGRDVTNAPPFTDYGFDEHSSTWESPDPDPNLTATNWIWSAWDKVKRWDRTSYFVDKTLDFLRRHQGQPCFVDLWPDDVHTPWVPLGSDLHRRRDPDYETGPNFKGVLAEYDKQVGRLLAGLKQLGIEDNTIIIFASDNGPLPTFHRARAAGLRGAKDSLYEGGTREPFIVRWPGHVPAGRVDEKTVLSGLDMFQIFCKLGGATPPSQFHFDGEDMSRALFGKSLSRKTRLFWEYGRNESFGYPREYPGERSPNVCVREGNWKLLVNADGSNVELYNLKADRLETHNLASEKPKLAHRLETAALDWRKSLP